jgi:hypothetical protein
MPYFRSIVALAALLMLSYKVVITSKWGAPMALITDMRNFAESLENQGQLANALVVTKAVEVLKKQQVLLQSQEKDITEMKIPRGSRKWRVRGPDRRSL